MSLVLPFHPQWCYKGWGQDEWGAANLSCVKDEGAGEAGLGAQAAACVGGDVLRCPPPRQSPL